MKQDLHPDYHNVTVRLANGDEFVTRSTMPGEEYVSDVDATNHPFYTGSRSALLDTTGRVEKFRRRYGMKTEEETSDEAEEAAAE